MTPERLAELREWLPPVSHDEVRMRVGRLCPFCDTGKGHEILRELIDHIDHLEER